MSCVHGGYQTLSPIQICNALGALEDGIISFRAFRVFFACVAELASRDAAERTARLRFSWRRPARIRFTVEDIAQLVECRSVRVVRGELRRLEAAGLLTFSRDSLKLSNRPIEAAECLVASASAGRSPSRSVPVPRPILRLLARPGTASTAKVVLAYMLRGLTRDWKTGEVRGRGSVKASWIAEVFGMSLRGVRAGRAELVRLGLIERDRGSSQWKLNRTGSYFAWNLAWPGASSTAPLVAVAASNPAPPIKRPGTPYGSERDQKPVGPGVFRKPNIREVVDEDLRRLSRLEELFQQAVRGRILDGTEADALNFVAAAVRATTTDADSPVRVFMGIVRRKLWRYVSLAQEDRAWEGLDRLRRSRPDAFRPKRLTAVPSMERLDDSGVAMDRREIRSLVERSLGIAA